MRWILAVIIFIGIVGIYNAVLNGAFLRCPYCQRPGAWRFDNDGTPTLDLDEDGNLIRSTQRKRCRSCGHDVDDVWSDHDGREIRRVDGQAAR